MSAYKVSNKNELLEWPSIDGIRNQRSTSLGVFDIGQCPEQMSMVTFSQGRSTYRKMVMSTTLLKTTNK